MNVDNLFVRVQKYTFYFGMGTQAGQYFVKRLYLF
jgi:hypothetical protein